MLDLLILKPMFPLNCMCNLPIILPKIKNFDIAIVTKINARRKTHHVWRTDEEDTLHPTAFSGEAAGIQRRNHVQYPTTKLGIICEGTGRSLHVSSSQQQSVSLTSRTAGRFMTWNFLGQWTRWLYSRSHPKVNPWKFLAQPVDYSWNNCLKLYIAGKKHRQQNQNTVNLHFVRP